MRILWSADLSLALPTINLWGPELARSLEGDDLASYSAARLLTADIDVFTPGPLAAGAQGITYDEDGIPVLDEDFLEASPWLQGIAYFGALGRIYDDSPDALGALLREPEALPSRYVASSMGPIEDPEEQERIHRELAGFVRDVADGLPGPDPDGPYFLTGSPLLGRLYVESQPRLSAQSTLALLAVSGITFALPRVAGVSEEGLSELRDRLSDERDRYLAALNDIISESYDALKHGDVEEAYRLAEFKVGTRLESERSRFERAAAQLGTSRMRRLGVVLIEGVPSIASAAMQSPLTVPIEVGKTALKALMAIFDGRREERELPDRYPLGSYAYRIRRELAPSD